MRKKNRFRSIIKWLFLGWLVIFVSGMLIPQNLKMPVVGANKNSYNPKSFWHEGWGSSIVHQGVDIFARKGTSVHSATYGIVLLTANTGKGGKCIVVLGPKWRLHYYAHLDEIHTSFLSPVSPHTEIGTVGNTGNAIHTPSHLHYSIWTPIPYPWRMDDETMGWKKMFILNPIVFLDEIDEL